MSTQTKRLEATTLRAILSVTLLVIAFLGVMVFVFGYQQITNYALSTEETAKQAQASTHVVQDLATLRQELDAEATVSRDASLMIAQATDYQYQEQIIETVTEKATRAGVTLDNISFTSTSTTGVAAPATAATGAVATSVASTAPAGVKTVSSTITPKNPVSYTKLLNFLYLLQNGVPSLSIASVNITKSTAQGVGDAVDCGPLTIEAYIQ